LRRNSELSNKLEELTVSEEYSQKKMLEFERMAEEQKLKNQETTTKLEEANNENLFFKSSLINLKKV
jgi:hypothetical protein